jgi:hypothetical protein
MSELIKDRYEAFRERFGTAGVVIGVIALVVALTGSAFAAGGGLSGKQKKEVKAIAKSFQGTGPEGKQGPAGTNGTSGKDGTNGANGTDGNSVKLLNEAPPGCGVAGGYTYEVEGTGEENEVCNGGAGSTTQTGTYAIDNSTEVGSTSIENGQLHTAAVSFTSAVEPAPSLVYLAGPAAGGYSGETTGTGNLTSGSKLVTNVNTGGEFTESSSISGTGIPAGTEIKKVISATELELTQNATASGSGVALTMGAGCGGVNGGVPQASPGTLCIYGASVSVGEAAVPAARVIGVENSIPTPAGVVLSTTCSAEIGLCMARGVWAVSP